MFVVGLTGGIGSGKSTVAELFRDKGIGIVDADLISREVVEPGEPALDKIKIHFGNTIVDEQGSLRRDVLRKLVFADSDERRWLEGLLHPLINQRIRIRLADCASGYCILMSPLLLETDQKRLADRILAVDVSRETQIARTLRRDNSSPETIEAIINAQISRDDRRRLADDLIDNDGEITGLARQVNSLHDIYLKLAAAKHNTEESL